jgi:hypothetical protein
MVLFVRPFLLLSLKKMDLIDLDLIGEKKIPEKTQSQLKHAGRQIWEKETRQQNSGNFFLRNRQTAVALHCVLWTANPQNWSP